MMIPRKYWFGVFALGAAAMAAVAPASAQSTLNGQVLGAGAPIGNATVTLWAASAGEPKQLAQTQTGSDGQFQLGTNETPGADVILYLVAKGGVATVNKSSADNPAMAPLTVLGNTPPTKVVVNEMTTVASVWTNAQFLDGTAIKGPALSLNIAAGNVPNFVGDNVRKARSASAPDPSR